MQRRRGVDGRASKEAAIGRLLPVTQDLGLAHAASLLVALLVAGVSIAGLVLGSAGFYRAGAGEISPSTAGVLVPGYLAPDAISAAGRAGRRQHRRVAGTAADVAGGSGGGAGRGARARRLGGAAGGALAGDAGARGCALRPQRLTANPARG